MNREDVIREIQERYRQSGRSLNEVERRLWAATEAMKIGWGGISLVSKALRISPNTIKRGIQEIAMGQVDSSLQANGRIRKSGGGRKSKPTSSKRVSPARTQNDEVESTPLVREPNCPDPNQHPTTATPGDLKSPVVSDNNVLQVTSYQQDP